MLPPHRQSKRERGRVEAVSFDSGLLRGNPFDDPTERELLVWLPPGYDREPDRRYATLYFLAGYTGTGRAFLNWSAWQESLPERLERLVAERRCPPFVAVMPDCFTTLGGSQYVDSRALGPYESHLAEEVVPLVDARFRTLGSAGRAVLGKSSGGIGALWLAMRRPGLFAAAASHSGDCAFEISLAQAFPGAAVALERWGGVEPLLAALRRGEPPDGRDIDLLGTLCCAAAYSPEPAPEPWGFSLPFDLETGATRPEVFEHWLSFDPVRAAARHRDALAGLKLLYLDAGRSDEYQLQLGARLLSRELHRLGVPHRHEEFDGGHRNTAHRYDVSVPAICEALDLVV